MQDINVVYEKMNASYTAITSILPDRFLFSDDYDSTDANVFPLGDVVAIQPDGKILVAGIRGDGNSDIRRYNADGTVDGSFSGPSLAGAEEGWNTDLALQSDGKIVLVGYFTSVDGNPVGRVCRLNTDGSVDYGYDPSSYVNEGFNNTVHKITRVPGTDDMIVGGQFSEHNNSPVDYLVKIDVNGTEDAAFTANWSTVGFTSEVHDIHIQSDGKILVCGFGSKPLVRVNSDGTPDSAFISNLGSNFDQGCLAIGVQSDGKILVGGFFSNLNGSQTDYGICRLNSDGTFDSSFALDGTGLANTNENFRCVEDIWVLPDDSLLVGGWFNEHDGERQGHLIKLQPDGSKDPTFVVGEGFTDDTGEWYDGSDCSGTVYAITVDGEGNVYCAGNFTSYKRAARYAFCKLDQYGNLLPFSVQSMLYYGIDDGGMDMYDGANYLNTNLTNLYDDIKGDNVDELASIPSTHTQAYYYEADGDGCNEGFEDDSEFGYTYSPLPDGLIRDGDPYFGTGSQYFTNMYPGLFFLAATDIGISQFSITGNIGSDGHGIDNAGRFIIKAGNKAYTCFYKTNVDTYNHDPSIHHLIIVHGIGGMTQEFDSTGRYDDHLVDGLEGKDELYYFLFGRGVVPGQDSKTVPLPIMQQMAQTFLNMIVYGENEYTPKLTPDFTVPQTGEGNLDTSVEGGVSYQRTVYVEVPNDTNGSIIVEAPDGQTFTNKTQTLTDYFPAVQS